MQLRQKLLPFSIPAKKWEVDAFGRGKYVRIGPVWVGGSQKEQPGDKEKWLGQIADLYPWVKPGVEVTFADGQKATVPKRTRGSVGWWFNYAFPRTNKL
jgi:hypothetical protein